MTAQNPPIRRGTHADLDDAAAMIAFAFHELPQSAWLVGSERQRAQILAANMRMWVRHALDHGHVDIAAERAVAVWFDRTRGPIPLPDGYDERLEVDCGIHADRFRQFDSTLDKHHTRVPHHHLAMLAVRTDQQGHGLGTALLRHHHEKLDASAAAAFLEASDPRNRALYERHGYRDHGQPYELPGDGPILWPMLRRHWQLGGAGCG